MLVPGANPVISMTPESEMTPDVVNHPLPFPATACSGLKLEVTKCPSPRLRQWGTVIEASQTAEQYVPVLDIKPSQLGCV